MRAGQYGADAGQYKLFRRGRNWASRNARASPLSRVNFVCFHFNLFLINFINLENDPHLVYTWLKTLCQFLLSILTCGSLVPQYL